jgi:hypothetical protein
MRWRQDRSLGWLVLLAPLVVGTPILAAYREQAGWLVMGLLLQPLALWVWSPVLRNIVIKSAPPPHPPRWVFVAGFLPAVWFASCTYGYQGEVSERLAVLESVAVPQGVEVDYKQVEPFGMLGGDYISYRVTIPLEEAEAEVYRSMQQDGWERRGLSNFVRDGDCLQVFGWISTDARLEVVREELSECYRWPAPPPSEGRETADPVATPTP